MHIKSITFAAGLLGAGAASPLSPRQLTNTPCHDVHMFIARGSFEGYDAAQNRQVNLLAPEVCAGRASCGFEDIAYPALIWDDYCAGSETQGVTNGLVQLRDYAARCPGSRIVLTGYSQGAQVVGDMLGGGGGTGCDAGTGALDPGSAPGNMIAAVTLFADTRRTPGQPYNEGKAGPDVQGTFPRAGAALEALNAYAGRMESYCAANDNWCASGTDGTAHGTTVENYHRYASAFIKRMLG